MSDVGLYGFDIPHDFVEPTRDMVLIRIPFPPRKIGSIITPQQTRDMLAHNVMAGRIVRLGPLAFQYKDGNGLSKQDAAIGAWVLIRPYAGTMVQGGQVMVTSGWRYVSSFQDIIGIIPADKMPDPATLLWDDDGSFDETPFAPAKPLSSETGVRERVVYNQKRG